MATIRRRGTKWQVQVRRVGHRPLSRSFHVLKDAEAWARHVEIQADRGELPPNRKVLEAITLGELVERYRDTVSVKKRGYDVEQIVLTVVGALQYSYAQNEARARAAAGLSAQHPVPQRQVEEMRQRGIAHHLFQAVGRGAIRKSVEGDCPPGCHLWMAASSFGKAPIPSELLRATFPEARVEKWLPVKPPLKDSEATFIDALEACLGDQQEVTLSAKDIADQAGCSWNTVLRRFEESRVIEELRHRGLEAEGPDKKSPKGKLRVLRC